MIYFGKITLTDGSAGEKSWEGYQLVFTHSTEIDSVFRSLDRWIAVRSDGSYSLELGGLISNDASITVVSPAGEILVRRNFSTLLEDGTADLKPFPVQPRDLELVIDSITAPTDQRIRVSGRVFVAAGATGDHSAAAKIEVRILGAPHEGSPFLPIFSGITDRSGYFAGLVQRQWLVAAFAETGTGAALVKHTIPITPENWLPQSVLLFIDAQATYESDCGCTALLSSTPDSTELSVNGVSLQKIESELLRLLSEYKFQRERLAGKQRHLLRENSENNKSLVQKVKVFITVKDSLDCVRNLGFEPQMAFGNIAAGEISLEEIEKIAELSDVVRIETPQSHAFMLDTSTKAIRANAVRTISGNTWSGIATGKGVIVAIIDSGINYEHRSFRNADGSTRIIGILDQSLDGNTSHPDGGTRPNISIRFGTQTAVINQGVVYTEENIRNALAPGGTKLRHVDTEGHGTHVAGIAAGNGFQRDHCDRFYPGVAPEADILAVKLAKGNLEDGILAAIAYSIHIADEKDKAVVINLSSSRDSAGSHDGSSRLERTIDFMLDNHLNNQNVSLVTIAGNNADQDTHATGEVPPGGSVSVEFQISNNRNPKLLDIWYPGENNNALVCQVRPASVPPTGEVLPGPVGPPAGFDVFGGGRIEIASRSQPNTFQNISIGIIPPPLGFNSEITAGTWRVNLRNPATIGQPIRFHAWVFYLEGTRPTVKFKSHTSRDSTVGIPGTARNVITVGSFSDSGGRLSGFSGRGPTIDNRQKPDITAPGEGITSADNDLPGCCRRFWCACCNVFHTEEKGTSSAAPHVAGAIALILELNPGLTRQQVADFLFDNALRDAATGPNPSNLWGAGKLNVEAAVRAVNATLPTPRTFASSLPEFAGPPTERLGFSDLKWAELQERFMNSPGGRFYYALADRYFDEIQSLINKNKRVATIWHRNDGPLILRMGFRALLKPDEPFPRKLNDLTVRERLVRIGGIIKRFATDALAADIDVHLPVLFQMEGMSINQIISFLDSKDNW